MIEATIYDSTALNDAAKIAMAARAYTGYEVLNTKVTIATAQARGPADCGDSA